MKIIPTEIQDVLLIEPTVHNDARGFFYEAFNQREFQKLTGISPCFVQLNRSKSIRGVLRGLHYQRDEYAQAKLVSCTRGEVFDIALDIRPGSPSFGSYVAVTLSDENKRMLYIPRGFAHGFAVLSADAEFEYLCDNFYNPEAEDGYNPFSEELAIEWPFTQEEAILSDKDLRNKIFYKHQNNLNP